MKKILCFLSAISMVLGLTFLPTKAAEMVEISTVEQLVEAIENGNSVKFIDDITVESLESDSNTNALITIDANQEITIDLNGHVLDVKSTQAKNTYVILNNGSLIIDDSSVSKLGKITYNYSGESCNYGGWGTYTISNGNGSTFVLNGGTLENTTSVASHIYYTINSTTYGEAVTKVTINDGKVINNNYTAIRSFENASIGKVVLTINGGTITGTTGIYLQNPSAKVFSQGELIINGGTINSTRSEKQAVYVYGYGAENIDGINIEVNGGTLNGYIHIFPETEENEVVKVSDEFNVTKEILEYSTGTKSFYYTLECAHKNTTIVGKEEATCTKEGYTGDEVCLKCNGLITEGTIISVIEHTHVLDETTVKEATCTEKGYTGDKKCECGAIIKGEEIPMLEHTHVLDETTVKEVTCTTDGYTGDEKCICGDTVKGEVIKATGHTYVNGECECGDKEETSESAPAIPEPEINTEVEKLPVVDTTKPVEEVIVGTEETSKEVINETVEEIIENIKEDKEVTNVPNEVVEAIKEEYVNGNDVDLVTEVVVDTIDKKDVNKETLTLIEKTANGQTVVQYLDLNVLVNVVVNDEVKAIGKVSELTNPMTFTIALPKDVATLKEGYSRTYYVIREHEGKTDKLPVTVNEDGLLSFTTDKFSTYALTYVDSKLGGTPNTSDNSIVSMYVVVATISLAILVVLKKKEALCK